MTFHPITKNQQRFNKIEKIMKHITKTQIMNYKNFLDSIWLNTRFESEFLYRV